MLGSSALLASLLMPRAVTPAAARTPADPSSFDDAAYWAFADRMQDQLDRHWDGHTYTPKRAMLSANLLLTHAAAALAGPHRPGAARRPRARAGAGAVQRAGVGHAGRTTGSQGHKPGWQDGARAAAASSTSWSTPRSPGR